MELQSASSSVVCGVVRSVFASCRVVTMIIGLSRVARAVAKSFVFVSTWSTFQIDRRVCCDATDARRISKALVNKAVDNHSRLMQRVPPRLGLFRVEVASC